MGLVELQEDNHVAVVVQGRLRLMAEGGQESPRKGLSEQTAPPPPNIPLLMQLISYTVFRHHYAPLKQEQAGL